MIAVSAVKDSIVGWMGGGGGTMEDMCSERLQAEVCVD